MNPQKQHIRNLIATNDPAQIELGYTLAVANGIEFSHQEIWNNVSYGSTEVRDFTCRYIICTGIIDIKLCLHMLGSGSRIGYIYAHRYFESQVDKLGLFRRYGCTTYYMHRSYRLHHTSLKKAIECEDFYYMQIRLSPYLIEEIINHLRAYPSITTKFRVFPKIKRRNKLPLAFSQK